MIASRRSLHTPLVRNALAHAGERFDVAVVRLAQRLSRSKRSAEPVDVRLAQLEAVARRYGGLSDAIAFPEPPPITDVRERHVRELSFEEVGPTPGVVTDMRWQSGFTPIDSALRDSYLAHVENRFGQARLLTHAPHGRHGRPTIVCIHGYRAGTFAFEERAWASSWLYRLGLDVAHFTLPFHALRAPVGRKGPPLFPSPDVARTNEAFAQAMWDLRGLVAWIVARTGGPVGVAGMSLGGYTTSLFSTVDLTPAAPIAFAVPFIPLGDLTDAVVEHEALRGTVVPAVLIEAGKRAMGPFRPLGRAPTVPSNRMLVVAAERDGITKISHAEQLAAHFGAPMVTFPGAHLMQFGRRKAFAAMARFLAQIGVTRSRA